MINSSQAVLTRARALSSSQLETTVRRAAWSWFGASITRFIRALAAELAARRATRQLEAYNDRELRDLGIFRSDIRRVVRNAS